MNIFNRLQGFKVSHNLTNEEYDRLLMVVGGAGMAAKAVLTVSMAGLPITVDSAVETCRHWMDPNSPATPVFLEAVGAHVNEMLATAEAISPPSKGRA
ncbi:hypothetical protein GJU93_06010 [Brucella sp. 10RB9212]|uniref:hypothetical protein n=1 Tax=unclassified Brucella TaxID=2632610 RepID=UPI000972A0AA|nr:MULTISPECIES: hypothetical protein [unclassified Brucella]APY13184.1 hypothetical protein BKD02_01685 [Brucella sp. 09RB8910]MRN46145.1 hypothetical protein [Brucella sp. 10RB9212]